MGSVIFFLFNKKPNNFYILVSRYRGSVSGDSLLSTCNSTMQLVAEQSNAPHSPLAFQLDIPWESASAEAKSSRLCVEKASEARKRS